MLLSKLRDIYTSKGIRSKICVVGDLMIDHYIFGNSSRLSPEAPVPILLVERETSLLGGAANVAKNLVAYDADVSVCGTIGEDVFGQKLLQMLKAGNIDTQMVHIDGNRATTQKTRIMAGNHHIARVDHEVTNPLAVFLAEKLFDNLKSYINKSDIVILSDYNKGLLTPLFVQKIINYTKEVNKKVLIDPKGADFIKYKGAHIIKPNKKELAKAAQVDKIIDRESLEDAAFKVIRLTDVQYLIVTLSEEGMALFGRDGQKRYFPVTAREVFDVTGAGDTVIATLANFLALGFDVDEACELANNAAAIVVKHIGSAVVTPQELISRMAESEVGKESIN